MQAELRSTRNAQLVAWTVAGLFLIGLFFSPVGAWTGPILGTWFVCTQRPLRGFTWMLAVSFLFSLPATGRIFSQTVLAHGPAQTLDFLSTVFVSLVLPILPFTFHRLVSSRLPGFFSTLPLPLAAMAFPAMILWLHLGAVSQNSLHAFLIFWLAAIIVWLWRLESRATALVFGTGALLAAALELSLHFAGAALSPILPPNNLFNGLCLCGALLLSLWALFNSTRKKSWLATRAGKHWSAILASTSPSAMAFPPSSSLRTSPATTENTITSMKSSAASTTTRSASFSL
jgi:hypothetical protein